MALKSFEVVEVDPNDRTIVLTEPLLSKDGQNLPFDGRMVPTMTSLAPGTTSPVPP